MNEPGTRQSEAEFERNARAMFDASIASLDARTLSRLNQARNRALQAASTASSRRHRVVGLGAGRRPGGRRACRRAGVAASCNGSIALMPARRIRPPP